MQVLVVLVALLAVMLTGCPSLSMTSRNPNDRAPWNDPSWDPDAGMVLGNTGTTPYYGPEYHYAWIKNSTLWVRFKGSSFQTRRKQEYGGGYDTVELGSWNKVVNTDSSGYGLGNGSYLQEDRGHSLAYFLISSSGWRNGEKFRLTLSQPGVISYVDTNDIIDGPGVRKYSRELLIVDSSKTY